MDAASVLEIEGNAVLPKLPLLNARAFNSYYLSGIRCYIRYTALTSGYEMMMQFYPPIYILVNLNVGNPLKTKTHNLFKLLPLCQ